VAAYNFSTLSPADFELMVRDLLKAEYGWQLEAFGHGRDGGVDLRAFVEDEKIVVQCKHYAGSSFSDLLKAAKEERKNMDTEAPDRYLFVTSQDLSRGQKEKIFAELAPWLGSTEDLLAKSEINSLIDNHPMVEQNNFKLWLASMGIIDRIVRNGTWERSEALMESVHDRVRLYVTNPSYQRASETLARMHSVIITGSPGVGKSMLADMLLLTYWHEEWQVVHVVSDISEGWDSWAKDRPQIFFYDDFLGQTDVTERLSGNRGAALAEFISRVQKNPNKRLVMTTRKHVLRQAELRDEPLSRMNSEFRECLLALQDYGYVERAKILYNHLYFSELDRGVVQGYVMRGLYWDVIKHNNFTPRIVEQILKRSWESVDDLHDSLVQTLERPVELWGRSFANSLSDVARRVLVRLVAFPVDGASGALLRSAAIGNSSPIEYTAALRVLEGTWISITSWGDDGVHIEFKDPSCRDYVLTLIDEEPDYALESMRDASIVQMYATILSYANTKDGNDSYKYPRLAKAVAQNAAVVSLGVEQCWAITMELGSRANFPARILAQLLGDDLVTGGRMHDWILGEALLLPTEKYDEYEHAAPYLEVLVRSLVEQSAIQEDSKDASHFVDLMVLWANSAEDSDEIEAVASFLREFDGSWFGYIAEIDDAIAKSAVEYISKELDDLSSTYDDPQDMDGALDEMRKFATEHGVRESLKGEFARAEVRISEYEPSEYEDVSPDTSFKAVESQLLARSNFLSADDKSRIVEMFGNLS
jgi:hypothetical protein